MDNFKVFVQKFKIYVLLLVLLLLVFAFLEVKLLKITKSTVKVYHEYSIAQKELEVKKQTLDELTKKAAEKKKLEDSIKQLKEFYKPIGQAMDTESVIASEFAEILELMRAHSVKTYSIQYEYDPQEDNFVKNVPGKFSVAQLNMQMVASYNNFKALLKELYKHEHFLDIVSINVRPYENNKRILIIDLVLKLYAQREDLAN